VEFIGQLCFINCHSLEVVRFFRGSKLSTVGLALFVNCFSIREMIIPPPLQEVLREYQEIIVLIF
jgi:hypothetical protein